VLVRWIVVLACLSALLLIINVLVTIPFVKGVNVTFSINVCLGFSVSGKVTPDSVKLGSSIAKELIVSGAFPVEVTVTGREAVDPTVTWPKFKLTALTTSCGLVRATPVLVRLIDVTGFVGELLVMIRVPEIAPVVRVEDCT
jgi:hypothetical protein